MADSLKAKDGFDFLMFQRLWKILGVIFPKWFSIPTSLFFLLLILCILEQYVGYHVGLISSHYYKVLGDKDFQAFLSTTLYSTLLIIGMALVLTTKKYVDNVLYIVWRQILGQKVHMLYFAGINYYSLNVLKIESLDNPDQRMTQDIDRLCRSLSVISVTVLISPFKISYYTYKTYMGTGWIGPCGVFLFFFIGTILNKIVMSPLVRLFMEQEKQEGNFRFKHMHTRVNSEAIAFYASGLVELKKTNEALNKLIRVQQVVFNRQFWLNMIDNIYDYMSAIISYVLIAIPIFNGTYDGLDGSDLSSLISKNAFLCMSLMFSFSQLVDLTTKVVALSGVTHRVAILMDTLSSLQEMWELQALQVSSSYSNLTQNFHSSDTMPPDGDKRYLVGDEAQIESTIIRREKRIIDIAFILNNVTVCTPDTKRPLIKDLNLKITKGQHLIIMGPSSCGKSSLLRVIRGLWNTSKGAVAYNLPPGPKSVLFLPQKPCMTNGSLYEQIIYPLQFDPNVPPSEDVTSEIVESIDKLLLHGLLQRCGGLMNDPQWNWDDVLSPGEMQRVCFLRLFHHKPQYAFLDEATSALSSEIEEYLYSHCLSLGITMVSVGHRSSLIKFHRLLLKITDNGTWTLQDTDVEGTLSRDVAAVESN